MKTELIKSILITDGKLCEEEIEAKLEEGDLTALPNSILQVRSRHERAPGDYDQFRRPRASLRKCLVSARRTRPNSWAKQVREIEWGHLTLDSMTF